MIKPYETYITIHLRIYYMINYYKYIFRRYVGALNKKVSRTIV